MPQNITNDIKARLYIYKGAMLKRIHELDEAEFCINMGLNFATNKSEINDGLYNLACIYGMQNKEKEFSAIANELKSNSKSFYNCLLNRLSVYVPFFTKNL